MQLQSKSLIRVLRQSLNKSSYFCQIRLIKNGFSCGVLKASNFLIAAVLL